MASTSGMDERHDQAGAQAEADEADDEHDRDRLEQRLGEAADGLLDHLRLVGDQMHVDADRQIGRDRGPSRCCSASPNSQQVGAGFMPMARPIAGSPLKRNSEAAADRHSRGVMVATSVRRKKRSLTRRLIAAQALLGGELAARRAR